MYLFMNPFFNSRSRSFIIIQSFSTYYAHQSFKTLAMFSQARYWVLLLVSLSLAMFVFYMPNLELTSFERAEERDDGDDKQNV